MALCCRTSENCKSLIQQDKYNLNFFLPPADFSPTFDCFLDPFLKPILDIYVNQQFKLFVQIFMLSDLMFKQKFLIIHIRKGMFLKLFAIYGK